MKTDIAMENERRYFERDISWMSFNYRVLMEALDESLPIGERIRFISIYTSNLEEFFRVRVAEHYTDAASADDRESRRNAILTIHRINDETRRQGKIRKRLIHERIVPLLDENGTHLYFSHEDFTPQQSVTAQRFFVEEIFPYLQPVPVIPGAINTFLRDNSFYIAVRLRKSATSVPEYYIMLLPTLQVPRFVILESTSEKDYVAFTDDIVKQNLDAIFPGYQIDGAYCFKLNRNADILVENLTLRQMVTQLKSKIKKRKLGAVCRFVYDDEMPADFCSYITNAFGISGRATLAGDRHLNLQDLSQLPMRRKAVDLAPQPVEMSEIGHDGNVMACVAQHDVLIHYPYHSFSHFIHFLYEAVHDPLCHEIMITQYRVAENSAVINTLIAAAQNGKKVTVFVELKARFDEENNLATAEMMKQAGINIFFRMPKLKVHAKVALILRKNEEGKRITSYGYIGTGNFNEQTALQYSDVGLFTCHEGIVDDLYRLFGVLQRLDVDTHFRHLLVAQYNLVDKLHALIDREIAIARSGGQGCIILKMNALQDPIMISRLYDASEAGVKVDIIVRGICCLVPGQPYSRNIRLTRIVDSFLEHSRVWYFGNSGNPDIYIGSADWMKRNLYRRIEAMVPVYDSRQKHQIAQFLTLQLADNTKGMWIDENLNNVAKGIGENGVVVRSQYDFARYLNVSEGE